MKIQNATLRIGRREILLMIAGSILYALVSYLANISQLANAVGAEIRPAVVIPIFLGFLFGPIVGFVTGFFGNLINDLIAGYVPYLGYTPTGSPILDLFAMYILNWSIGNGISGLIPGILALYHRRYRTWGDMALAVVFIVLAVVGGIGFAASTDIPIQSVTLQYTLDAQFLPIVRINLINALLLVPILLFNAERLDIKNTNLLSSGLLRLLVVAIVVSAALPTFLLGIFLTQQQGASDDTSGLYVRLAFTILLTLAFTIVNSVLIAQTILRPLLRLTEAAGLMQVGKLAREKAANLKDTVGTDEISQLSQLFGRMAEQVIERESALKRQLESLRIEIDQTKQTRQVAEITDNEFFRDLQSKARSLRNRDQLPALVPVLPIADIVEETAQSLPLPGDDERDLEPIADSNPVSMIENVNVAPEDKAVTGD